MGNRSRYTPVDLDLKAQGGTMIRTPLIGLHQRSARGSALEVAWCTLGHAKDRIVYGEYIEPCGSLLGYLVLRIMATHSPFQTPSNDETLPDVKAYKLRDASVQGQSW